MCTIAVGKHLLVILPRKYANLSKNHFVLVANILVVKLFVCLKRAEILCSDISCAYLLNKSKGWWILLQLHCSSLMLELLCVLSFSLAVHNLHMCN